MEAHGGFFGLFLEIKMEKRYATKEQKQWITDLTDRGYKALITKGLENTITAIDDYLKQKKTNQCLC
jgi:predicted metal-dependent phosphotriesterase family hydrolase